MTTILKDALIIPEDIVESQVSDLQVMAADVTTCCMVHFGKKGVAVYTNRVQVVKCCIRGLPGNHAVLFQSLLKNTYPKGLELFPVLVDIPSGSLQCIEILIQNVTRHDI